MAAAVVVLELHERLLVVGLGVVLAIADGVAEDALGALRRRRVWLQDDAEGPTILGSPIVVGANRAVPDLRLHLPELTHEDRLQVGSHRVPGSGELTATFLRFPAEVFLLIFCGGVLASKKAPGTSWRCT